MTNTAKKTNVTIDRTAKNLETRKAFFETFSKKFEIKKNKEAYVWAAADDGDWKEPYCYVHFFQKDTKHQLFYYLMAEGGKTINWKMSREVGALIDEKTCPVVTRRHEIIKTDKKTGKKRHTQTCLYTTTENIPELVKFAKILVAAAQKAAETKQSDETAEPENK